MLLAVVVNSGNAMLRHIMTVVGCSLAIEGERDGVLVSALRTEM